VCARTSIMDATKPQMKNAYLSKVEQIKTSP